MPNEITNTKKWQFSLVKMCFNTLQSYVHSQPPNQVMYKPYTTVKGQRKEFILFKTNGLICGEQFFIHP